MALKQVYKVVDLPNGTVTIYGSNRPIQLEYGTPEWNKGGEAERKFRYNGQTYYLSEFEVVDRHAPKWMKEFDGQHRDSYFSGILIKYLDDEYIKAFTYIA